MSGGTVLGKPPLLKSISTPFRSPYSLQKLLMTAAIPRYSSLGECNSCAKALTSVSIPKFPFVLRQATVHVDSRIGRIGLKLLNHNRQTKSGADHVFVKVACDPVTLPFLCFNHPVAHA